MKNYYSLHYLHYSGYGPQLCFHISNVSTVVPKVSFVEAENSEIENFLLFYLNSFNYFPLGDSYSYPHTSTQPSTQAGGEMQTNSSWFSARISFNYNHYTISAFILT